MQALLEWVVKKERKVRKPLLIFPFCGIFSMDLAASKAVLNLTARRPR